LGLWDVRETKASVQQLLHNIHLDILSQFAVENEMSLTLTGDYKILAILTGSLGQNSNHPCIYCNLAIRKGTRPDRTQYLITSWETYLSKHDTRAIITAPEPILSFMEIMGYSSYAEAITPPSLHAFLSLDRFIQIATNPRRMIRNQAMEVSN